MGTDIADPAGCGGYSYGGSNFGSVVSSSRDGSRLAVSRALHYVKVYEWSDATNWTESGQVLLFDNFGSSSSMQMSGDGTHIAIGGGGNVAVFEYTANGWTLKGSYLQSDYSPHNGFGDSVSISDDGTRLAVGEPQHENNPFNCTDEASQGATRVYEWNNGQNRWDKMGSSFFCHNKTDDQVGYSISISGDGNRVAVGAPKADAPEYCDESGWYGPGPYCYSPSQDRGQVRVYEWSANSWQLMGGVPGGYIDGNSAGGDLGRSVALSLDGTRLIAGAPLHDSCVNDAGTARVYEWDSSSWVQIGSDLTGTCGYSSIYEQQVGRNLKFGWSVSMVADGNHVAVGTGTNYNGEVRVFEWKSDHNLWHQKGLTMDNSAEVSNYYDTCAYMPEWGFGNSVSISQYSKGTRVFVGMPRNVEVRVLHMTTCDDPVTAPAHGSIGDCMSSISLGTTCQFDCNNGYGLSGLTKCSAAGVLSSAKCNPTWLSDAYHIDKGSVSSYNNFGGSVSISGDGKRVASVLSANNGLEVYVYERVAGSSELWQQVGDPVYKSHSSEMYWMEWSQYISLSKDGLTVAIGYPAWQAASSMCRVFEWKSGNWTQLGGDIAQTLYGGENQEYFGQTISLADNGRRVAVGTNSGNAYVRVYELQESEWVQWGMPIIANTYFQDRWYCGTSCSPSVSLTGDGNMIAVGFYKSNVTVHRWLSGTGWVPVGAPIDVADFIGQSAVALSDDGNRVIVGHQGTSWVSSEVEYAKVFEFISEADAWLQMGSNIQGSHSGEYFGRSVSITRDGSRVAIGGPHARHFTSTKTDDSTYGVVRVYDWVSNEWMQQGSSVYGYDMPTPTYNPNWGGGNGYGRFGASVSISDDGLRLAVGESSPQRVNMFKIPPWTPTVAPAPSSSSPEASPEASPETPSDGDRPASQPAKEKKEKAEKTRDAILGDITNSRLKAKAKLLADAAIAGVKVKRLSAKLTADSEETACSTAFTKAGMSSGDGACVATAASSGKRRRLSSTTYDVELMFSSSTVSDDALAAAELEMKNNGVEGVSSDTAVDPIAELKTVPGVDTSKLQTFETEASDAATAAAESQTPPPPTPPPPPKPNLVLDDDDGAVHLHALTSALLATALALVAFM